MGTTPPDGRASLWRPPQAGPALNHFTDTINLPGEADITLLVSNEDGTQRLRDRQQAAHRASHRVKTPFGWSVVSMTQFTLCRKWQVKSLVSGTLRGLRWLRAQGVPGGRGVPSVGSGWGRELGAPPGASSPPRPCLSGRSGLDLAMPPLQEWTMGSPNVAWTTLGTSIGSSRTTETGSAWRSSWRTC